MEPLALDISSDKETSVLSVREVTPSYLQALRENGAELSVAETKNVRSIHHKAARYIAYGDKVVDVARKTGLRAETLYRLQKSPAFANLVLHYAKEFEEKSDELHDRIESAALQVLDEIQDRMEQADQMEDTTLKELANMLMGLLDRVGHAPVKRVDSRKVSLTLSEAGLERIKRRASERRFTPEDRVSGLGDESSERAVVIPSTAERVPGSGSGL